MSSVTARTVSSCSTMSNETRSSSPPSCTSKEASGAQDIAQLSYPPVNRPRSFEQWTAGLFPGSFDAAKFYMQVLDAPQPVAISPFSFDIDPSDGESAYEDVQMPPRRRLSKLQHLPEHYRPKPRKAAPVKRRRQTKSNSIDSFEESDEESLMSPGAADDRAYYGPRAPGVSRVLATRTRSSPSTYDDLPLPDEEAPVTKYKHKRRLPASEPVKIDRLEDISVDSHGKPTALWWQLVRAILIQTGNRPLSLDQICDIAQDHFSYFKTCQIGWKGTIRSVLTTKPCFLRDTIPDPNDPKREILRFTIEDSIDPRRQRERTTAVVQRPEAPRTRLALDDALISPPVAPRQQLAEGIIPPPAAFEVL